MSTPLFLPDYDEAPSSPDMPWKPPPKSLSPIPEPDNIVKTEDNQNDSAMIRPRYPPPSSFRSSASAPYARPSRSRSLSPDPLRIQAETRAPTRSRRNYIDLTRNKTPPPTSLPTYEDVALDYAVHASCACRACKEAPSLHLKSFDWLSKRLKWTHDKAKRNSYNHLAAQYRKVLMEVRLMHRVIETDRKKLSRLCRHAYCSDCQNPMDTECTQTLQCGHMFCIGCVKWYIHSAKEAEDEPRCIDCQEVIKRYKPNYQLGELIDVIKEPAT